MACPDTAAFGPPRESLNGAYIRANIRELVSGERVHGSVASRDFQAWLSLPPSLSLPSPRLLLGHKLKQNNLMKLPVGKLNGAFSSECFKMLADSITPRSQRLSSSYASEDLLRPCERPQKTAEFSRVADKLNLLFLPYILVHCKV